MDLAADITLKEQELARLQERRRGTLTALELQLKRKQKGKTGATATQEPTKQSITPPSQETESENSLNLFPANLPEEYVDDAMSLYFYTAMAHASLSEDHPATLNS